MAFKISSQHPKLLKISKTSDCRFLHCFISIIFVPINVYKIDSCIESQNLK